MHDTGVSAYIMNQGETFFCVPRNTLVTTVVARELASHFRWADDRFDDGVFSEEKGLVRVSVARESLLGDVGLLEKADTFPVTADLTIQQPAESFIDMLV